jgi:hypothetical protein
VFLLQKDIEQAKQLISVLLKDRPGDQLLAWDAALDQPGKFLEQLRRGTRKFSAPVRNELQKLVGGEL